MRILVVEDDRIAAGFLLKGLREAGHSVDHAEAGKKGLALAASESYDVIVLDRMLPQVDGMAILRTLRASKVQTPVLILSALGEVQDRIEGLQAGSDDYLVKPFSMAELLARLVALQRRHTLPPADSPMLLKVGDLELDLLKRAARRGMRPIDLKPKELQFLEYLMRHANQLVTRSMLLEGVWDYQFDPKTNVIDVHISNLRNKIDLDGLPALIHTVRGVGYRLGED